MVPAVRNEPQYQLPITQKVKFQTKAAAGKAKLEYPYPVEGIKGEC
jgi:hypothetical protein